MQAERIEGRTDVETSAEGRVELRRDGVVIKAGRVHYNHTDGLARAAGDVSIERQGDRFSGPLLNLNLDKFEGWFESPSFFFARSQAGGDARRVEFIDRDRSILTLARYTSCDRDGSGTPPWMLSADSVRLDFAANEALAKGAVLRFYGVPILGAPVLSLPVTDARKSGWLPPTVNLDSKSGLELAVPYYWNWAPNRDATFTPTMITRRGFGLGTELRYLEPKFGGQLKINALPDDRLALRSRYSTEWAHDGTPWPGWRAQAQVARVSDDAHWKDFSRLKSVLTPRLLPLDLALDRQADLGGMDTRWYARVQRWQVLQDADLGARIAPPYQRNPQIGGQLNQDLPGGLQLSLQGEFNHFTAAMGADPLLPTGARWHAVGRLSRTWETPGAWLTPSLSFNHARYALDQPMADGRTQASRTVPTLSIDSGLRFERDARWLGTDLRQTLEPRLRYVNTPFRAQASLPNFDAAGKDFNVVSVFSDSAFSGIDRVSDAHQFTAGVSSRLLDRDQGHELARFAVAQRLLMRDQQITPEGPPFTQPVSDVLLLASSQLSSRWAVDAAVQYSPDLARTTRSTLGLHYQPGPFRTLSTRYRFARSLNEQVEVGWQWPVWQSASASSQRCSGRVYSVGRLNFSARDSRLSIHASRGLEYNPITRRYSLSADTSVNYLLACRREA